MYKRLIPFIRNLTILSIVLVAVYGVLIILLPDHFVTDAYYAFIPFFFVVTMVSRLIMNWQQAKSSQAFANGFISVTMVRFMVYVAVLLLYSFGFPDDAIAFIITFFAFYFIYSLFEVFHLYHNLKNKRYP